MGFQPACGRIRMTVVIYRERGYLPHLKEKGRSYFVTFRLADSVCFLRSLHLGKPRESGFV